MLSRYRMLADIRKYKDTGCFAVISRYKDTFQRVVIWRLTEMSEVEATLSCKRYTVEESEKSEKICSERGH